MAMNYKEATSGVPKEELIKYSKGIARVDELVDSLRRQDLLPERFSTQKPQVAKVAKAEAVRIPLSAETQRLVERLRRDGLAVYQTEGKTPIQLTSEGMKYWFLNPALEDRVSEPALLAFRPNPQDFFLKGSQNIPWDTQVELLDEEIQRFERQYPDSGMVMRVGHLPEWTELSWKHFQATKVRPFGRDFGFNHTWTDTYENERPGARRADVGRWDGAHGLSADLWGPDDVLPDLGLAPLVEIPQK